MRILIITHLCYPEPDLKGLPFAKKLISLGHSVEILTGFPNYPAGVIYPGYKRRFYCKEEVDGVSILRFFSYFDRSESSFKRITSYLSFAFFGSIIGLFKTRKADVVYVNMTPALVAFPALVIKFFRRSKVLLDIQDLWPETLKVLNVFKNEHVYSFIDWVCKLSYRYSDKIVVPSKSLKKLVATKGVNLSKIEVIYNWSTDTKEADILFSDMRKDLNFNCFTILYAGNVGQVQNLEVIIEAAEILKENFNLQFAILGGGIELPRLRALKKEKKLNNVKFIDQVSVDYVSNILNSADALLVHLTPNLLYNKMIPSKTQAYLKQGKPILMGVDGEASDLIKEIDAGLIFPAGNSSKLAERAVELSNLSPERLCKLGNNGKDFYNRSFSMDVGVQKFLTLFKAL